VIKTAVLYGILGIVLFSVHRKLAMVTDDPERARAEGMSLGKWDFLFYLVLGLVVTSSVQVAGVLLVFTLLVVPSVMAIRLFTGGKQQFIWILTVGTASVIIGSGLSYLLDLPTGAAIVCTFGLGLGLQIILESLIRR
jgi:zinc/manganese transport system permease protein